MEVVEQKLTRIVRSARGQSEKLDLLSFIDTQHVKWCASGDWLKDGGAYVKSLDAWLSPQKKLWVNEPLNPAITAPARRVIA